MGNLIAASDFVVQPSLEDALPTALISALAAARPIVATNVGGIPDIVRPGCGLLVEPGRPSALSDGIAQMANDNPLLTRPPGGDAPSGARAIRAPLQRRHLGENLRAVYGKLSAPAHREEVVHRIDSMPESAHRPERERIGCRALHGGRDGSQWWSFRHRADFSSFHSSSERRSPARVTMSN